MKRILSLAISVSLALTVFAQEPMATLDHNDSITVFHSHLALKNAYNAAVEGDIITLSEGEFDANFDFTKSNITLRGAGMFEDTVVGTTPTKIRERITFKNSVSNCTLEGIYFSDVYLEITSNFLVRKCRFNKVQKDYNDTASGYNFYSCVIHNLDLYGTGWDEASWINSNFFNCIIACNANNDCGSNLQGNTGTIRGSHIKMINCYAQLDNTDHAKYSAEYYNCILYARWGSPTTNLEAHNCIGLKRNDDGVYWDTTNTYNIAHNLINMTFSDVFVNFDGTYHPGIDNLELTPTAQAILGFDGTEIGIHGGTYPYNPHLHPVAPIIGYISVPRSTNNQGMLDVNVEIISEQ